MLSDDMRLEAQHKLAAGRILASRKMPYFTTALMAISPFEREGLGPFAVDSRWRMYYDPQKCIEYTVPEICAVWLHEVGHLIRSHSKRFAELEGFNHDPRIFNCAGDAAINSDLRDSDIILPNPEKRYYAEPNPEFPEWKKGMTAEEMYFIGWHKQGNIPPDESENGTGESEDKESGEANPETESLDNPTEKNNDSETNDAVDDNDESSEKSESESNDESSEQENGEPNDDDSDAETSSDGETSDDSDDSDDKTTAEDGVGDTESDNDSDDSASDKTPEDESETGGNSSDSEQESGEPSEDPSDDTGDADDSASDELSNDDGKPNDGPSNSSDKPDCGSAVDGEPRDYEEKDTDDGSVDESTGAFIKQKTAESIMDFEKSNPGSVPGGLLREAKDILDPQVDWQSEFAALIRHVSALHAGYADYSYQRPSRRSSGSAFIMPSMRQPPAPEITIILDTSGSMDESKELAMALGEMEEIVSRSARFSVSQSVRIINCDAVDNVAVVVRDLKDFEIIGGGGTDMRVGIKAAAEMKPAADIVITITDGFTPWPNEIPYQNTKATYIALIVGRGKRKAKTPPDWMKVIDVVIPEKRNWSRP